MNFKLSNLNSFGPDTSLLKGLVLLFAVFVFCWETSGGKGFQGHDRHCWRLHVHKTNHSTLCQNTGTVLPILNLSLLSISCNFVCVEPYLDFTCVASQALVPSPANTSDLLITAYSPLSNASFILDGQTGESLHPIRVGAFKCSLDAEEFEAETAVIISTEDG